MARRKTKFWIRRDKDRDYWVFDSANEARHWGAHVTILCFVHFDQMLTLDQRRRLRDGETLRVTGLRED